MALLYIRGVVVPQPPIPSIILQGHHRNKVSDANKQLIIQKYTENIPTVGGVIKLAIINEKGFKWISGQEVVKHENFFH